MFALRLTLTFAGAPVLSWFIALSEDGVTYDEQETLDRVGTTFRYVRIRVEIDSASGLDLARINDAILRLDVKLRTDQGDGCCGIRRQWRHHCFL